MTKPGAHAVRSGELTLWRDVCVRGTGFPSHLLLRTAAEATTRLVDAALERERAGGGSWLASRAEIEAAYSADRERVGEVLREVARMPRFREALLWQNRNVLRTAIEPLLRRPASAADSSSLRKERMLAIYLQRYCAKNDTIGFFGPVGWGKIDDTVADTRVTPGPALLARRTVYFEYWPIDTLAAKLSEDRELRATLPPRRMPTSWLEGDVLHYPIDRVTRLPEVAARLVAACDGQRPANAIAEELLADPALELGSVDEIYDLLDELAESRIVVWRLEVPTTGFRQEEALRAALAAAEPSPAREAAEAAVDELVAARDRVGAATSVDELDAAMGALEETFVKLTASEASRNAGETYGGRGLIFEDCRRDVELVLGRSFLDKVSAPLALLQQSARWFTHAVATGVRPMLQQVYRELVEELGSPEIDLIRYYGKLGIQAGALGPAVAEARGELQRRWGELLVMPEGQRRVELRAADLAPRVKELFAAPAPGWPWARHISPDLLIAAAGPEALARGEFTVVLGEIHAGHATPSVPAVAKEHRDPQAIHEARRTDVGQIAAGVEPRMSVRRASVYSLAADDLDVEFGDARSHRPRDKVFDVAGFVVTEAEGRLWAARRDGSARFDLIAFMGWELTAETYNFDLLGPRAYQPRISIDGVVIARERWRFPTSELAFASAKTPVERFVGARRWAAQHGIPRFTFVKSPEEPKPVYLDLASPVYVEIIAKILRAAPTISISEMLPSFDQLWLVDAEQQTYCSELRVAMVDDEPWAPL